ncbi:hypothetical protein CGLO_13233 [Colletotrichum gloeosporioides Cg-14]|uniref:Uncharacterized protein n=1 Tax=Colletotrichum gloeosporioides (strain Cg-14) TaxID=1237896 RepID=T0JWX3_COLGC|nr:hypothetical protein CGLO_13233 [Colletotrichum gloeosporioides Cg-14]
MGKTRREIMSLLAIRSSYREPFVFLRRVRVNGWIHTRALAVNQINIPPCVLVCQERETNPMNIPTSQGTTKEGPQRGQASFQFRRKHPFGSFTARGANG